MTAGGAHETSAQSIKRGRMRPAMTVERDARQASFSSVMSGTRQKGEKRGQAPICRPRHPPRKPETENGACPQFSNLRGAYSTRTRTELETREE